MGYIIVSTIVSGSCLDTFQTICSIASDLGILLITGYTFWLKFLSKDIQVSKIGTERNIFKGQRYSVTLVNHTLHPVSVDRVEAVMDNKLRVAVSEKYTTIAPFNASTFSTSWFETNLEADAPDFNTCTNLYFEVFLSHGGNIRIVVKGTAQKQNDGIENLTLNCNAIGGIAYSKCCRYLITYIDSKNNEQNILVLNNGYLETPLFYISRIPEADMKDSQTLYNFIKTQLNIDTNISDLSD